MKCKTIACWLIVVVFFGGVPARAHFGMIIPSDTMVMQGDPRTVQVTISFSHPFEMVGMNMEKPKTVGVFFNGQSRDLLPNLVQTTVLEAKAWSFEHAIKRPGAYLFYAEPAPYWEPAENAFIIHHTKTVIAAFGDDEGWDAELGLKTEIVPLSKPFGLYTGNVFQGVVKLNGKPVPFAKVEVEYFNRHQSVTAPTEFMITQTLKADRNGVFTYAAPRAGWWGFAALNPADFQLAHDGRQKEVELGAVIWVRFHDLK